MPSERILIVEDESITALYIKRILIDLGYQVSAVVDSGKKAVAAAIKDEPDLILMDIYLKDKIDGIEAASKILTKKRIPIVFITAFADDEIVGRAKKVGPFGYIIKPFSETDLKTIIEISLFKAKLENELYESKLLLEQTLDSLNDSVLLLEPSTLKILKSNKVIEEMFGYIPEELKNKIINIFFESEEKYKVFQNNLHYSFDNVKQIKNLELELLKKVNFLIPTENTITPIIDKEKELKHWVWVIQNITIRKELEKEISEIREKERDRICRKIHDELGQDLTGIAILLKNLGEGLSDQEKKESLEIKKILDNINITIRKSRGILSELRSFDVTDLNGSIRQYLDQVSDLYNIKCTLNYNISEKFDSTTKKNLYYIVRESVNNSVKHSKASEIKVKFLKIKEAVEIKIKDNGKGIKGNIKDSPGFGLKIMEYRSNLIGGSLTVSSEIDKGTTVKCSLPFINHGN